MSSPPNQITEVLTTNVSSSTSGEPNVQAADQPLLQRLKSEMKKHASLLEHVPLDDIETISQTEVPNTLHQMLELGTVTNLDGSDMTLVACMASKGLSTATDGGVPRILLFGYGPNGLSQRRQFTAREVSRFDSLNATFAPANANPDILLTLIKYVFIAKDAAISVDVDFTFGFTRALGQACRAYKQLAAKRAGLTPKSTPDARDNVPSSVNGTLSAEAEAEPGVEEDAPDGIDTPHDLSEVVDARQPPMPSPSEDALDTSMSDAERSVVDADEAEVPQSARSSTKRSLKEYQDLQLREDELNADIQATAAAKALMQISHQELQVRLDSEIEAKRKALEAERAAKLEAMHEAQEKENAARNRHHETQLRLKQKIAAEIAHKETSTPLKEVWAMVNLLQKDQKGRTAKRRKMA